jgi:ketosteroid isomerase-like protein
LRIFVGSTVEVGLFEGKGKEDGKPFHWRTRYTATWLKKNGVWVVTAEQDFDLPSAK